MEMMMFYFPKTVASMVAGSPLTDLYSDLHKDAIGCRPGAAQMAKANAFSPVEAAVEERRLSEWMREGERIDVLRGEVARFDFSRRMEYLQRREGISELEAFKQTIQLAKVRPYPNDDWVSWEECLEDAACYGWDFLAMDCGLPQSDGAKLQEYWEANRG